LNELKKRKQKIWRKKKCYSGIRRWWRRKKRRCRSPKNSNNALRSLYLPCSCLVR